MWREYGDSYKGVSVGFRATALTSLPVRIQKVKYLDPDTPEQFRQLIRDIASNFDPRRHSPADLEYWLEAATSAFTAITALKHDSWAYEREVRLIHVQARKEPEPGKGRHIADFSDGTAVLWSKPLSRPRGDVSVDYKTFPFGLRKDRRSDPTRAIERIVLGPRCPLTVEEGTALLEADGFENFEVIKSECEIR